jgi:hypothetical protein
MPRERKKLPISCDAVDCEHGLHCFNATKEMKAKNRAGPCWQCGADLVDWDRIRTRNLADVAYTFKALKYECVRHFFWHKTLNQRAINHARRKGKRRLRDCVRRHLEQAIGPANPFRDGSQTTMSDDVSTAIPYGRHATATCCRKCLEFWHNIPQGVALAPEQLDYCAELVCLYIEDCIPELTTEGEWIPPIRRQPGKCDEH